MRLWPICLVHNSSNEVPDAWFSSTEQDQMLLLSVQKQLKYVFIIMLFPLLVEIIPVLRLFDGKAGGNNKALDARRSLNCFEKNTPLSPWSCSCSKYTFVESVSHHALRFWVLGAVLVAPRGNLSSATHYTTEDPCSDNLLVCWCRFIKKPFGSHYQELTDHFLPHSPGFCTNVITHFDWFVMKRPKLSLTLSIRWHHCFTQVPFYLIQEF